jgi:Domain of unknown function (DUF4918)
MNTLAQEIKKFNSSLEISSRLPTGIRVMNPFKENSSVKQWMDSFYDRFYSDVNPRRLILGINPGRLGAGQTGIPFTDTKRLYEFFGLGSGENITHEASSAFIYEVINSFGGAEIFYSQFLVSSVCPLGFVMEKNGKLVNFNYYDSQALQTIVKPFIVKCMEKQLAWPISRKEVFCLGTGKNLKFLQELNEEHRWFEQIVALEHPRYIMQYKSRQMDSYIQKYLDVLGVM